MARAFPDVRIFAISPDPASKSRDLARKIAADGRGPVGFSFLSDVRSVAIDRYRLRDAAYTNGVPHPSVFVLDQSGRIRWTKIESDYRERPSNEEV
ncbi:MAG: hypothetical protein DMF59_06185, partial [Acidobacteria bacterium]